ncbi:hypothetical protein HKCCE2091_15880 [Rhodobacterales bacterium HKCCE2091]|nr:hypothetical protein [Rhodobacterales bacterium HKCCE2091]
MFRTTGALAPFLLLALPAFAQDGCDRTCLIDTATALAEGGDASAARVTENGVETAAAETWGAGASGIHVHNAYADAAAGQAIVVGTGTGADGAPAIFGLRVRVEDGAPTEAEWLVTHDGEASLFPREIPVATDGRFEETVPEDRRVPRDRMIELANTYFDGIELSDGAALPVDADCNRVENGIRMTHSERFPDMHCNTLGLFTYIPVVEQRRFPVVDEERGVVVAIVMFQIPEADIERVVNGETTVRHYDPRSLYLFEAFKVSDDDVDQIEATMRDLEFEQQIDWPAE